jgi:hypothetical protein
MQAVRGLHRGRARFRIDIFSRLRNFVLSRYCEREQRRSDILGLEGRGRSKAWFLGGFMRRHTGLYAICALAGTALCGSAFLIGRPAAMPFGGIDPMQLLVDDESGPVTSSTQIPPAMRDRLSNVGVNLQREFKCMALNIYWEAKGEPLVGQIAVASVTLNRLANPRFPKSVCDVVWQGVGVGFGKCQFSWACDRRIDLPQEDAAWQRAQQVAYRAMFLDPYDPTDGALYFHANYVRPDWVDEKARIMRIGRHIFYGEGRSSAALEPS